MRHGDISTAQRQPEGERLPHSVTRSQVDTTMLIRFWLAALLLLPILAIQGPYTRRTTLRLPQAGGACQGHCGQGPELRLLIIGESPVAGVGVTDHQQGLGPALAAPLAQQLDCQISWYCHGKNGLRLAELAAAPLPEDAPQQQYDLLLVMMGVNDTTSLTPLRQWREQLQVLIRQLQPHCQRLCFLGVPPIGQFTALPQPLRAIMGLRARLLQQQLAKVCQQQGLTLLDPGSLHSPTLLAEDGFHPSKQGFLALGQHLSKQLGHR